MSIELSKLLETPRLVALYNQRTTLSLEGPPGTGKSSVVREFPRILGEFFGEEFGYCEQLAPSLDAPDVRGFMIPTKDEQGRAIAKYTYPAVMPTPEYLARYPRGVAFVDEFYQADHLVAKGFSPYILEKTIGDFSLPEGWWVVIAGNRMSDRSGVVKPLMHNINRVRKVEVRATINGWVKWAQENSIHPMGIAFAKRHPGTVMTDEVPAEPRPFCTPRSFTSAMRYLQELAGDSMDLPSDTVTQELVSGDIGEGASAQFFGFIKVADHLPTIEEIKADPENAKCPSAAHLDAAYAAHQMIVHHSLDDEEGVIDTLWTYAQRLPRELQAITAKELLRKGKGAFLNSPAFGKWIRENNALITATTID